MIDYCGHKRDGTPVLVNVKVLKGVKLQMVLGVHAHKSLKEIAKTFAILAVLNRGWRLEKQGNYVQLGQNTGGATNLEHCDKFTVAHAKVCKLPLNDAEEIY